MRRSGPRAAGNASPRQRSSAVLHRLPPPLHAVQVRQAHHAHHPPLQPGQSVHHVLVALVCTQQGGGARRCRKGTVKQRKQHGQVEGCRQAKAPTTCSSARSNGAELDRCMRARRRTARGQHRGQDGGTAHALGTQQGGLSGGSGVGGRQISPIITSASRGFTCRKYSAISRTIARVFIPSTFEQRSRGGGGGGGGGQAGRRGKRSFRRRTARPGARVDALPQMKRHGLAPTQRRY